MIQQLLELIRDEGYGPPVAVGTDHHRRPPPSPPRVSAGEPVTRLLKWGPMVQDAPSPPDSTSSLSTRRRRYALVSLGLLALIWGLAWPIMKMSLDYVEPFSFAALRAVLSALVLMVAVVLSRRPLRPPPLGWTALLGLFQTAGFAAFSFWALEMGAAGKTVVLAYTMPFWLLLMAWAFLGEKMRGLQWVAAGLALLGLVFILTPWELRGAAGSFLAIATGLAWAAGAVVAKIIHKRHRVDVLSLTAWQMALGAIPLVVIVFATGYDAPEWSASFIWMLAYNVLLSNGLAWILWLFVLKTLSAGTTGLASLANPVLGVTFSWFILGEQPLRVQAVGMALIILGIAVLALHGILTARARRPGRPS